MSERIVITGCGCCTPAGPGVQVALDAVARGACADDFATAFDMPADLPLDEPVLMARAAALDPNAIPGLKRPFPDRPSQLAIVALDEALESAGLTETTIDRARLGLIVNTTFPADSVERCWMTLLRDGPARMSPMMFARTVSNAVLGELTRRHNILGASTLVLGSSAVGYGFDLLQQGDADAVVCVGVDTPRDVDLFSYHEAGLLRQGLLLGEAAAAVVLEREHEAVRRRARTLAQVVDYASTFGTSATLHVTETSAGSIGRTMKQAFDRAGFAETAVDLIVGLSNRDRCLALAERTAIASLVGANANAVFPKLTFGETFAAAGVLATLIGAHLLHGPAMKHPSAAIVNACEIGGCTWSVILRLPSEHDPQPWQETIT